MTNVGVVVFWNNSPLLENQYGYKRWLSFFTHTMNAFGADTLIVIGAPDISNGYDVNFEQYNTLEDALKVHNDIPLVALTSSGTPLKDFIHPEKALYIVGDDYGDVNLTSIPQADNVKIENPGNIAHLWAHNCIAITFYDKYLKTWQ